MKAADLIRIMQFGDSVLPRSVLMVVMRVAVVMAVTVADAVAMTVQAFDFQGRRVEFVLRAGHVNVGG